MSKVNPLRLTLVWFVGFVTSSVGLAQADLTLWTVHTPGPELQSAMTAIIEDFEAQHPDIRIEFEPVAGGLVYPKFLTAVQGEEMPDVADGFSYHPLQFAALDQMLPLNDIYENWEANGTLGNIVNEYAYRKFFWQDNYWAVPWNLDVRAIYYRKDLLEEAGLEPPTNWEEFREAVIALNNPDDGTFGLVYPGGDFHITQHYYMMFMLQAGGSILNEDGDLVFGTDSLDANVEALKYLTDFTLEYDATPSGVASYNTDEVHTLFTQGRAAFALGTGGLINKIMAENPDMLDDVGVLETLQGPEAKLTAGFYNPLFVWKFSPNPEAAKTFITWLVQPGRLTPLYEASPGEMWPILTTEFDEEIFQTTPIMREMLEKVVPYTVDFAYPGFGRPEMGAIDGEKLFAVPVNEVLVGAKTAEQAVLDAHEAMSALFE